MLAERLRRWPNLNPTLGQCLVSATHRSTSRGMYVKVFLMYFPKWEVYWLSSHFLVISQGIFYPLFFSISGIRHQVCFSSLVWVTVRCDTDFKISDWSVESVHVCDDMVEMSRMSQIWILEILTLWLPGRGACQDPDILVYELYFSSFEAGIADAISSFKWRKIHKCSIYLTKICVILWLRSLTNDDGNFRHVW